MDVWQFILDKHSRPLRVMLLYVLESLGSSPGRQGFKMAVSADGDFAGTIGGGIMEHKFVEMAKSILGEQRNNSSLHKQIHDKAAGKNQSGMICSGEQTIFLYEVQKKDIDSIQRLRDSLLQNYNGSLHLTHEGIFFSEQSPPHDFYFKPGDEVETFLYKEKTGYKNVLHIVGGGHCSLALSRLMQTMDFYIHVYDERGWLNTLQQNEAAHEKTVVAGYEELADIIEGGENVYVVIMTFGYRTDDIALRALLGKSFKYIGMLGSQKKIEKLFAEYASASIDPALLATIHTPIGVQVKSQTTAEIAVSIAAEIISVKNKGLL